MREEVQREEQIAKELQGELTESERVRREDIARFLAKANSSNDVATESLAAQLKLATTRADNDASVVSKLRRALLSSNQTIAEKNRTLAADDKFVAEEGQAIANENSSLAAARRALKDQTENDAKTRRKLHQQLAEDQDMIDDVENAFKAQGDSAKRQRERLQDEIAKEGAALNASVRAQEHLQGKLAEERKQITDLEARVEEAKAALAKGKAEEANKRKEEAVKAENLRQADMERKRKAEAENRNLMDLNAKVATAQHLVEQKEEDERRLRGEVSNVSELIIRQNQTFRTTEAALREQLEASRSKHRSTEEKLAVAKALAAEQHKKVEALQGRYQLQDRELAALKRKYDPALAETVELQKDIKSKQADIELMKKALDMQTARMNAVAKKSWWPQALR